MDVTVLINQMVILLMIMGVGYILGKAKFMGATMNAELSKLVADILQAGLILTGLLNSDVVIGKGEALLFLGVSFLMYFFLFGLSFLTPRALLAQKSERGAYGFMTVFGNVSFMGYPVVLALYGREGLFYASLFNVPFGFLLFTAGIVLLTGDKKLLNPRMLISPPLISSIIALILFFAGIRVPEQVYNGVKTIGDAGIPLGMMIIGSSLSRIPLKTVFGDIRAYAYSAMKLLIVPALTWGVFRLFVHNELLLGMTVLMSGMPAATIATMFSIKYGANETVASKTVLLSTLLSAATIPLVVSLFL